MPIIDITRFKITPRDQQVITLLVLVQGCSNKEIDRGATEDQSSNCEAALENTALRAGIRDGRKRVQLATAMFARGADGSNHVID
jgi:hypothetical protein